MANAFITGRPGGDGGTVQLETVAVYIGSSWSATYYYVDGTGTPIRLSGSSIPYQTVYALRDSVVVVKNNYDLSYVDASGDLESITGYAYLVKGPCNLNIVR